MFLAGLIDGGICRRLTRLAIAIALAIALSFGLGNRDLAGEVTREWYNRYRAEREAINMPAL